MRPSSRVLVLIWVFAWLGPGVLTPATAAQSAPTLDIQIERDTRKRVLSSALAVTLKVTITERDSGNVPKEDFEVYAFADNTAGERSEIFPCGQERDNDPRVPRGIYVCTVIVDHGGVWGFHGVVNEFRVDAEATSANVIDEDAVPVTVGQASITLTIETDEVVPGPPEEEVEGSALDVALLWGHSGAAGVWFGAVALLIGLAVPGVRRRLSALGVHALEERLDLIVKTTWTATGLVVGTGTYLTFTRTAYDAPFSTSAIEAVFALPYGKPYFLSLWVKIGLYLLMVGASVPLIREAQRRLRFGLEDQSGQSIEGSSIEEDPSPWGSTAGRRDVVELRTAQAPPVQAASVVPRAVPLGPGSEPAGRRGARTALATREKVESTSPKGAREPLSPNPLRMSLRYSVIVIVAGGLGISVCVTLLKYFHELVEAARGIL